jgi:acetyl-CoA carboxylase biotin carboxylase subunit
MFQKILIANRGEIAVRILRACRELGIETVAVYSDVERCVLHVRHADEAHYIGQAPARESYLRADRILDAARKSGAEAIHPGYGFLSENADFAAACAEAGLTFIGPPASAIADMGDKVAARRIMRAAGVPVIPGTDTDLADAEILAQAEEVGFPLFIKAAAGGGGKGMRLVETQDELERGLGSARREALNAFGDDRVYLERAIEGARHVEIQVLADAHGHVIHLGERECSVQRRHQKLVEEAPSPATTPDLRRRMGEIAVAAATAVGYVNAGTVEFLLDQGGNFYFLEMNTRLQVEHGVTEWITDVDIVQQQLRIAAGEPLEIAQRDVAVNGWAIECRITAEDPTNGFLPATGRVTSLFEPSGPGVRVDSALYEGFEVSPYYDPLLSKLIVWGETRHAAIGRMRRALDEYRITGVPTSIPFCKQVLETEAFVAGTYDTGFIERHAPREAPERAHYRETAAIAAVLLHHQRRQRGENGPSSAGGDQGVNPWKLVGRREAMGR